MSYSSCTKPIRFDCFLFRFLNFEFDFNVSILNQIKIKARKKNYIITIVCRGLTNKYVLLEIKIQELFAIISLTICEGNPFVHHIYTSYLKKFNGDELNGS